MKKYILLAVAVLMFGVANAKVIRIHYSDGTTKVYTSSELSTIDFNNNGTVTVYAYDGSLIPQPAGKIYESVTVDDQEAVTEYASHQLEGEVYGVTLGRRNVTAINMVYPSVDPANNSVSLSGTILIPDEIMNGEVESEGVILVHHFTLLSKYNIPTRGYYDASVKFLFCNSLNLNYIVVVSDFYGFGATERFPQAYLLGEANARASLDALKAARRILCNEGINCGPLTFNLGASSAGFDAMEALRVIQTRPGYESIHFDKTFAYAGPYDVKATFNHYIQQDTTYYSVGMPIAMVSYKEHGFLSADYNTMFKPLIADHIDSWFLSKDYTSAQVLSFIGPYTPVSELLQPDYCSLNSTQTQAMLNMLGSHSVTATGWVPDTNHRIFLMHSHGDEFVPFVATRRMLDFLTSAGYKKSIIPGRTNLQTNVVNQRLGHTSAGAVFMIQTMAAMKAWPLMYSDDELNPYYDSLAHRDLDVVGTMRQLDEMGFDCRQLIRDVMDASGDDTSSSGEIDIISVMERMDEAGIDLALLMEILDDSGINGFQLLLDLIVYLTENSDDDAEGGLDMAINRMLDVEHDPNALPMQRYAYQLMRTFKE